MAQNRRVEIRVPRRTLNTGVSQIYSGDEGHQKRPRATGWNGKWRAERGYLDLTRSIDPQRLVVTLHGLCCNVVVVVVAVDIVVDIQRLHHRETPGTATCIETLNSKAIAIGCERSLTRTRISLIDHRSVTFMYEIRQRGFVDRLPVLPTPFLAFKYMHTFDIHAYSNQKVSQFPSS